MLPIAPPEDEAKPAVSHAGAAWLNGFIWLVLVLGWLSALANSSLYLGFLVLLAAALGAASNLVMCLVLYATGQPQRAHPYLIGFLPLAALNWWVWSQFSHSR